MKCEICGRKINWDNSYGRSDFLICHPCFEHLHKEYGWTAFHVILEIGAMKEEEKMRKEKN